MADAILVVNAGSSSIKFAVFHVGQGQALAGGPTARLTASAHARTSPCALPAARRSIDRDLSGGRGADHRGAMDEIRAWLDEHRGDDRVVAAATASCTAGASTRRPF